MASSQQKSSRNDSKQNDSVVSRKPDGPQGASPAAEPRGPGAVLAQGPGTASPAELLNLQQAGGNRAVGQFLSGGGAGASSVQMKAEPGRVQRQEEEEEAVQAKAEPGRVQRQEEEEEAMQAKSVPGVQRQEEEEEAMQAKSESGRVQRSNTSDGNSGVSSNVESSIESARGGGSALPKDVRGSMEQSMGADFSNVRIHTGSKADNLSRSIQARAFTTGNDVFFRSGEYNPGSRAGKELLAHELTHTVQQGASNQVQPKIQAKLTLGPVNDKYEQEADAVAKKVVNQDSKSVTKNTGKAAAGVQRKAPAHIQRWSLGGAWKSFKKGVSSVGNAIGSGLSKAGNAIASGAKWVGNKVASGAKAVGGAVAKGAKAAWGGIKKAGKWVGNKAKSIGKGIAEHFRAYDDFDGKQYRISGSEGNRLIQEVKRQKDDEGNVTYYAMGEVTGFNGNTPVVNYYPEPISLGDWYPSVTHVNGMAVKPKSGIGSAVALQDSVNEALRGKDDVALGQNAVDVLYTYSAKRGGMIADLVDCIKGKVRVKDQVTGQQTEIMVDAVRRQKRVTVSAHSRGTIKTDNAVRAAHKILTNDYKAKVANSPEVKKAYKQALKGGDPTGMLSPQIIAQMAKAEKIKQLAAKQAADDMNKYIQLIYAGNAVEFPSKVLQLEMFVGGKDFVSMSVGTYSEFGMKVKGHRSDNKLNKLPGKGHGFTANYADSVGQSIANDIEDREDFQ